MPDLSLWRRPALWREQAKIYDSQVPKLFDLGQARSKAEVTRQHADELDADLRQLQGQIAEVVKQMKIAAPDRDPHSQWPQWDIERQIREWAEILSQVIPPQTTEG